MKPKSVQSGNPAKSPSSPGPRSRRTAPTREPLEITLLREFVSGPLVYNVHGDRVCAHCGKQESFAGPFSKRGTVVHPHCVVTRARKFLAAWDRKTADTADDEAALRSAGSTWETPVSAITPVARKPRKRLAWDT